MDVNETRLARNRAKNREYYADSHAVRENNRREWTAEEDAIVVEPGSLTDHELAELLGRSTHAVDHRRCTLKKRASHEHPTSSHQG